MGDMMLINYTIYDKLNYTNQSEVYCVNKESYTGRYKLQDSEDLDTGVEPEYKLFSDLSCVGFEDGAMNLDTAVDNGTNLEIMPVDADQIFEQDDEGDTMLHTAIISKRTPLALDFIRAAPTAPCLSIKNQLKQSPLHLALLTDQVLVVRKLLAGGCDVTDRYRHDTPLHIACSRDNMDMVTCLLQPITFQETLDFKFRPQFQRLPPDLESRNGDGLTPLHIAASQGSVEMVSLLVKSGADVNAGEGKTGRTILHNACLRGDINMVKTIMNMQDCDVNARAMDDFTPFDFARFGKHDEIQILLARLGAGTGSLD